MKQEKRKKIRIGIDARFYGEAGPGRYTKNIIQTLEKSDYSLLGDVEYIVYLRDKGMGQYTPASKNFLMHRAEYEWYTWGEQIGFLFQILKDRLDIFYVPHFNIPTFYPGKIVTAIPDIIMHTYSTERGTTLPKFYFKFKKLMYKFVVWWAVLRSYKVIVPSNDVLNDFLKYYPSVSKEKYLVAYEGVDPIFQDKTESAVTLLQEFGIKKPYLLYISSMYEHKNVPFLVEVFEEFLNSGGSEFQLVLVGKKDKYSETIFENIKARNLSKKIIMPGLTRYMGDSETIKFRKEAHTYVFPSLKEGFSLTPLEAQKYGLPCIVSDIPCHREIYGNTVLYFDPVDKADFLMKLKKIVSDNELRKRLTELGYENIKKYSWEETAKMTLQVFSNLLKHV